jgi:hypothetical protein
MVHLLLCSSSPARVARESVFLEAAGRSVDNYIQSSGGDICPFFAHPLRWLLHETDNISTLEINAKPPLSRASCTFLLYSTYLPPPRAC